MIVVINAGSTSIKCAVFDKNLKRTAKFVVHEFSHLEDGLRNAGIQTKDVTTIGHRVVHGGKFFHKPTVITPAVLERLSSLNDLAPLHNPKNIAGIVATKKIFPKAKHVAVFDTGFYSTLPDHVKQYALPHALTKKYGIQKYGFHGISHQFVSEEVAKRLRKPLGKLNVISCHLGGGCSVTATKNGKAFDTSMGFTPLSGVIMTTRSGDIDPEIPLFLLEHEKLSHGMVRELLTKKSGFYGVSGHVDFRDVLAKMKTEKKSKLAFLMFCYSVARYVGAYGALLKKVDAVVFTGGIGEGSAVTRRAIMKHVALPGKPKTIVIPANEELAIAQMVSVYLW